jgi:molybdate transport system permease protein
MSITASTDHDLLPSPGQQALKALSGSLWIYVAAALTLLFLVLPVMWLVHISSLDGVVSALQSDVTRDALLLSVFTTSVSTLIVIVFGGALAYALAQHHFPGAIVVDTIIDVPMVLPPMVAGLALMMFFGRCGPSGTWLAEQGIHISFSMSAVIIAQVFVSLPFFVRAARAAFDGVDKKLVAASLLLGASKRRTFFIVTLPTIWPPLLAGAVLAWARSLGEFGATLVFAGNFQGQTQTMPLAIFGALQDNIDVAITLSLILLVVSFGLVALLKLVSHKYGAKSVTA